MAELPKQVGIVHHVAAEGVGEEMETEVAVRLPAYNAATVSGGIANTRHTGGGARARSR